MKRRIVGLFELLLAFCMMLGVFTITASAAGEYTFDPATGELVISTNAGITAWEGSIAAADIKSITVEDSVTEIMGKVFQDLVNLEELVFEGEIKISEAVVEEVTYVPFNNTVKLASITFGGKAILDSGVFQYSMIEPNTKLKELTFPEGSTFGAAVFSNCNALEKITFTGNVEITRGGCFNNLSALKTLEFKGESVLSSGAFSGAKNLETILFEKKTNVGSGLFQYSTSEPNTSIKELSFPADSKLGSVVFSNCTGLEKITFEGDMTCTGGGSFANLTELKTLEFKGESKLFSGSFTGTTKLETITFGGKTDIPSGVFSYSEENPNTKLKELIFPEGSVFGASVFTRCTSLEKIVFEGDVNLTSGGCFSYLSKLKTLDFKGESTISSGAFSSSVSLESVSFGEKTNLGSGLFCYNSEKPNTGIKELTFPEGSEFQSSIFTSCYSLEKVTFEGDVNLVGGGCFGDAVALNTIVFKGESILGTSAFYNSTKLSNITFGGKTKLSAGVLYYDDDKPNTELKELIFPEGSEFSSGAVSNCASLEKIVFQGDVDISAASIFYSLPELKTVEFNGTSKIGPSALSDCGKLTNVIFKDVTELGINALAYVGTELAGSMAPIVIPAGSTIGERAFAGANISIVEFKDETVPVFGENVFAGCPEDAVIYVPSELADEYINALNATGSTIANPEDLKIKKADEKTNIIVVKEWDVPVGTDIPQSVKIVLYGDGVKVAEQILNEENNWTYTFTEIPVMTEEYETIIYTIDELETPEGYAKTIGAAEEITTGTKFVIKNTLIPKVINDVASSNGKFYDKTGKEIASAEEGQVITIKADKAPDGKVFDKWIVVNGDVTLADATKAETTFVMSAGKVSIVATYKNAIVTAPVEDESESIEDSKPADKVEAPDSGDSANIVVWVSLLVSGLGVMCYLYFYRKRVTE